MVSLKELKENVKSKIIKVSSEKSKLTQLPIGFGEETFIKKTLRKSKSWIQATAKNIRVSGIYTNVWIWTANSVLLSTSIIYYITIREFIGKIPSNIGLSIDGMGGYNYIVSKDILYLFPLLNLIIIPVILILGYKFSTKLNHILLVLIFVVLMYLPVQFFALRNIMAYFSLY
jgi:hypothetical protein